MYRLDRKRISNGSFTLTETDSGMDSDLDSKFDGYIVLNMLTLHRLRLGSLLPISVQDRNLSVSLYLIPSPAM